MTGICYTLKEPSLLSPRTAHYVGALIREGEKFDYTGWLRQIRAEEAEAKQTQRTSTCAKIVAKEIDSPVARPNSRQTWQRSMRSARHVARSKGVSQLNQDCVGSTSAARIRRCFEKTRDAWDEFQASRARDAVYGYLEAVFAIVKHYKVRRKTKKLLRHAFKFTGLPFDKNADPFSAVIRSTSNNIDSKTISKWARALRYAVRCKEPEVRSKTFMEEAGGVNACAGLYARRCKRDSRRSPGDRN